jgi:iron complex outermembrane receptor protein
MVPGVAHGPFAERHAVGRTLVVVTKVAQRGNQPYLETQAMSRTLRLSVTARVTVAALLAGASAVPVLAQTTTDLALVSLEDLMNIEITSAARKEQRADAVPAAVYVITQDDIRRSGMTTVPELLRLVPGLQVAQINANVWAVSSRGFNGLFSNKLLVLVDGRSIYDQLNSGQSLETEDLILEDIDRIEVVRGPGGAIWGADAVNGVINILTKQAGETQGVSVRMSAGTLERAQGSVRYGGAIGPILYRIFTQWSDHGSTLLVDRQTSAGDSWSAFTSGLRADWKANHNAFMFESDFSAARLDPLWAMYNLSAPPGTPPQTLGSSDAQVTNVLGRWTHSWDSGSVLQVQSFFDSRPRFDVPTGQSLQKTSDLDVQYRTRLRSRHDVVIGAGSRSTRESLEGGTTIFVTPSQSTRSISNAFVQDEIALAGSRVHVTLGSKIEHDTYASWGVQPTARVMWDLPRRQHVWAAVSRALRTPSIFDLGLRVNVGVIPSAQGLPTEISLLGNPASQTERVVSTEAGYRVDLGTTVTLDLTGFSSHYARLQTYEPIHPYLELVPGPPHVLVGTQYANLLDADTVGIELTGRWQPVRGWRLDGSYTGFRLTPHVNPASRDLAAATADDTAPRHQWQIHSSVSLGPRAEIDGAFFHVGPLQQLGVAGYSRADARVEVKLTTHLSAVVVGQNLSNAAHAEFGGISLPVQGTLIPRSVRVQMTFRH